MQLGKTLVGAIIGAALGIGLLLLAHRAQLDAFWLAIPVAILTGLGVRLMVSTSGHASYARGAITGILALAAYLGGLGIVQKVAVSGAERKDRAIARPMETPTENPDELAEPTEEPVVPPPAAPAPAPRATVDLPRGMAQQQVKSPLDYVWLAVAALIAYELGRGSDPKPGLTAQTQPTEPVPAGTHPDA